MPHNRNSGAFIVGHLISSGKAGGITPRGCRCHPSMRSKRPPRAAGGACSEGPQRVLSASRRRYHEVGHRGPANSQFFFFRPRKLLLQTNLSAGLVVDASRVRQDTSRQRSVKPPHTPPPGGWGPKGGGVATPFPPTTYGGIGGMPGRRVRRSPFPTELHPRPTEGARSLMGYYVNQGC